MHTAVTRARARIQLPCYMHMCVRMPAPRTSGGSGRCCAPTAPTSSAASASVFQTAMTLVGEVDPPRVQQERRNVVMQRAPVCHAHAHCAAQRAFAALCALWQQRRVQGTPALQKVTSNATRGAGSSESSKIRVMYNTKRAAPWLPVPRDASCDDRVPLHRKKVKLWSTLARPVASSARIAAQSAQSPPPQTPDLCPPRCGRAAST